MGERSARRLILVCRGESGNAVVTTLLAMLLSLVVLMAGTNWVVDEYARGVLRTAVDEGAAAGSVEGIPDGAVAGCEAKEREVMAGLLRGAFARGVQLTCSASAGEVVAVAQGRLPGWLPPIPALRIELTGASHLESDPQP